MTYYCFLCNKEHKGISTKEHFIPRSINGPEDQWLPVCGNSNTRSNCVFDNGVRDILYMARFQNTKILKRTGDALLGNGNLQSYKFSYDEPNGLKGGAAFEYFFDKKSNKLIPSKNVYAIKFSVGLDQKEQEMFCRGVAKMSIGALAYLLEKESIQISKIKQIFTQKSIDSIRKFALKLPWIGNPTMHRFSLGRTDVLFQLQRSCKTPLLSNHVIEINFQEKNSIQIKGMLYSRYGWELILSSYIPVFLGVLRLENTISEMLAPEKLRDKTLSLDSIVILNPQYKGKKPPLPRNWRNSHID